MKIDKELRKSIYIFSASKALILIVGILATLFVPIELTHRQTAVDNWFLNAWAQYDARAYLDIAENGYNAEFPSGGNYAWYPLYPLLIKIFSTVFTPMGVGSVGYGLSAFLISNIASFLAVYYLFMLAKEEFGDIIAKRSVLYFSFFPTVYFLTAMYAESLLIALSVASFYYAKKEKWLLASTLGFFAAITRIQGAFLFFPLVYMYYRSHDWRLRPKDFVLLLPIVGPIVVMFYHYTITGNALIQFSTQAAYGRVLSFPWESFASAVLKITSSPSLQDIFYHFFNILMALGFLALALYSFKVMKKEYGIYFLISMLIPLSSTALLSISRHNLAMFPAFMLMAKLANDASGVNTHREKRKYKVLFMTIYIAFLIMLVFFTARHVNEWFIFDVI